MGVKRSTARMIVDDVPVNPLVADGQSVDRAQGARDLLRAQPCRGRSSTTVQRKPSMRVRDDARVRRSQAKPRASRAS